MTTTDCLGRRVKRKEWRFISVPVPVSPPEFVRTGGREDAEKMVLISILCREEFLINI